MSIPLANSIKYIKGIGPERGAALAEAGIATVGDLLHYLPFRYEDRMHFTQISAAVPGQVATILAEVVEGSAVRFARARNAMFHLTVQDSSGRYLYARFFHGGYMEGRYKAGQRLVLHGKIEWDPRRPGRKSMVNPQIESLGLAAAGQPADSTEVGRIVPIYEAVGGVSSRMLRRIIYSVLIHLDPSISETLPPATVKRHGFPSKREALLNVHFPRGEANLENLNSFRTPAHLRLIFEEFFFYQLGVALRRRDQHQQTGMALRVREDRVRRALKRILPFKPTAAQKRVLADIAADLEKPTPMYRLLEGDVGSGKTIVALEAAVIAIENDCQVALMAPTEILAVQHFLSARRILEPAGYPVELVISAMTAPEKRNALERVRSGAARLVVGTHALIEDQVEFHKLGLVIVDEQHRFGVMQRQRLIEKGAAPHVLVMTATPIPRTLALTVYGDLDLSVIDELPPGRTPIHTRATTEDKLPGVWEFVRREIAGGRQAYIVYPVIEESKLELKAAMAEFERLGRDEFPKAKLGLLHGRLKSVEKEDVMDRFRRGELQILVATTVIEVGVDVPNATVMVIEHADRFGLAQLHQLRGRIGRGSEKSTCVLVAPRTVTPEGQQRIDTMVATSDGFEIAEHDLKLRGPGEFFGTRQHGDVAFSVAHPLRDAELLELARREAFEIAADPAQADELLRVAGRLGPEWQQRYKTVGAG
jgi:ATP-dependent DNA helicase RecG